MSEMKSSNYSLYETMKQDGIFEKYPDLEKQIRELEEAANDPTDYEKLAREARDEVSRLIGRPFPDPKTQEKIDSFICKQ